MRIRLFNISYEGATGDTITDQRATSRLRHTMEGGGIASKLIWRTDFAADCNDNQTNLQVRLGHVFQVADLAEDLRSAFTKETGAHGVAEDIVNAILCQNTRLIVARTDLPSYGSAFSRQNYVAFFQFPANTKRA
jgi:hypothetical protein